MPVATISCCWPGISWRLHGKRYGKPNLHFSDQAEDLLLSYSWPGNVRELRNMLEQTVLLAQSDTIAAHQLNVCLSLVDEPLMFHQEPPTFQRTASDPTTAASP